jgi:L-lactate dehydrogenase complex protein LldG
MPENARNKILEQLKRAERKSVSPRPDLPPLREIQLDAVQRKAQFMTQFTLQGGVCYPVPDQEALYDRLSEILQAEDITRIMATEDAVLAPLKLDQWGQRNAVEVVTPSGFKDRQAYTRAVFDHVQAGITGADFAVAESGTLILAHDRKQTRLVSLAPLVHVAVVHVGSIVATYDIAMEALFGDSRKPSQVTFITGPSMTADIQATMFKGMHGPQKIFALLLG